MEEELKTLQRWVDESSRIVFFGGAGVSTESGIPDFRSVDGLYLFLRKRSKPFFPDQFGDLKDSMFQFFHFSSFLKTSL